MISNKVRLSQLSSRDLHQLLMDKYSMCVLPLSGSSSIVIVNGSVDLVLWGLKEYIIRFEQSNTTYNIFSVTDVEEEMIRRQNVIEAERYDKELQYWLNR